MFGLQNFINEIAEIVDLIRKIKKNKKILQAFLLGIFGPHYDVKIFPSYAVICYKNSLVSSALTCDLQ